MRLVFAGTPAPALVSLEALLASRHEVVAVVTRPDARSGRGRTLAPSPVAARALEAGLELLRPTRPSEPEFAARLGELAPDACPIVAYGALIPPALLALPRFGWINLHFSLLPAWRGAAPVQRAIMAGDDVTGASTFLLDEGLDTGPVFGTTTTTIHPGETSGALLERLAREGARLLVATLDGIEDGMVSPVPQPDDGVSLAPKITAADARIDWNDPAVAIERRIRAVTPEPGAWTELDGERFRLGPVKLLSAEVAPAAPLAPGLITASGSDVIVGTGTTPLRLGELQPPGKKRMDAAAWARGARLHGQERFA